MKYLEGRRVLTDGEHFRDHVQIRPGGDVFLQRDVIKMGPQTLILLHFRILQNAISKQ